MAQTVWSKKETRPVLLSAERLYARDSKQRQYREALRIDTHAKAANITGLSGGKVDKY